MWSRARRLPADCEIQPFQWIGRDEATHQAELAARRYEAEHPDAIDEAALRAEIAALEKEAFAKGYAHGEREGNAVAAQRAEVLLTRLSQTIDDLAALRSGMLHKTERDVVRMAVAIAERIVHRTLAIDPELLLAMARVAIDRLGDGIVATIHLHPEDHRAMVAVRAKRPDVVPSAVAIEPDATIARGGCVVRSEFGVIDLGLDAQIAEVSRALLGEDRAELGKTA
jgi:flagellar assembly protein FliH